MKELTDLIDRLKLRGAAREIATHPERFNQFLMAIKRGTRQFPIKSSIIEYDLGISGSVVRALRALAQHMGHPIGSETHGYFWARCADELDGTEAQLESRCRALIQVLNAIRKTQNRLRSGSPTQEELF